MLVSVVLDKSGSMNSNREGTISGYNEFLNGLKVDKDTKYSVTLIQFDTNYDGPELAVTYSDKPLDEVPVLSRDTYQPRGTTPLHDAIGECIRRVDAKGRPVMVVIITDGQENASKEFTLETVKKLRADKEAEGWKFVFIGADMDSYSAAMAYGISSTNTANYTKGHEGATYGAVAQSVTMHASNVRAHGMSHATAMMDTIGTSNREKMVGNDPAPVGPTPPATAEPQKKGTKWRTTKS